MLILREVALTAPTHVYPAMEPYVRSMWPALRDANSMVYGAAARALQALLQLVSLR